MVNGIGILGLGTLTLGHPLGLFNALLINVDDGQLGSSLRQSDGYITSQAICSTGDEHMLALDLALVTPSLMLP